MASVLPANISAAASWRLASFSVASLFLGRVIGCTREKNFNLVVRDLHESEIVPNLVTPPHTLVWIKYVNTNLNHSDDQDEGFCSAIDSHSTETFFEPLSHYTKNFNKSATRRQAYR